MTFQIEYVDNGTDAGTAWVEAPSRGDALLALLDQASLLGCLRRVTAVSVV